MFQVGKSQKYPMNGLVDIVKSVMLTYIGFLKGENMDFITLIKEKIDQYKDEVKKMLVSEAVAKVTAEKEREFDCQYEEFFSKVIGSEVIGSEVISSNIAHSNTPKMAHSSASIVTTKSTKPIKAKAKKTEKKKKVMKGFTSPKGKLAEIVLSILSNGNMGKMKIYTTILDMHDQKIIHLTSLDMVVHEDGQTRLYKSLDRTRRFLLATSKIQVQNGIWCKL